jgi:AraC-like DNA-binding protein/photosystem II stability/assembly factor-like uncharacterized protein
MPVETNVSSPHVRRMLALIEEHAGESLSLATLARALGRQQAYLGRLFRQQMGVSTREYVVRVRLERAAGMICQGDKVEAVALEVGYRSKKNFYRQFIRHFGTTPAAYRARAATPHRERMAMEQILEGMVFRPIGPPGAGGFVTGIAGLGGCPATLFVASTGGLWRTTNNGTSWQPVCEERRNVAVAVIAAGVCDPNAVWMAPGRVDSTHRGGGGIYVSRDAGTTWTHACDDGPSGVSRLVVDPHDPAVAYAVAAGCGDRPRPANGLYRTSDGGRTWRDVTLPGNGVAISDVSVHPRQRDVLLAAVSMPDAAVYESRDGGAKWTKLSVPFTAGDGGAVAIGRCRNKPEAVYACARKGDGGILRSNDGGRTWRRLNPSNAPSGFDGMEVDPDNPDHLYLQADRLYQSHDGGSTLGPHGTSGPRHGGAALWIDPADRRHVVAGDRGSIATSYDGGDTWLRCRNLSIAHVSQVAADMQRPYNVYAGLQQSGACMGPGATRSAGGITCEDWFHIPDGHDFAVPDAAAAGTVYTRGTRGQFVRFDARTGEHKVIHPEHPDARRSAAAWDFPAPLAASPSTASTIHAGGRCVFKSTDRGVEWTAISPALASPGGSVTAFAESPWTPGLLYAGTDDGRLFVCREGGQAWSNVSSSIAGVPAGSRVSRIVPSSHEPDTAYVAFDSSALSDSRPYLFVTNDAGRSWTSISANLPAGAVHVVRDDPRNARLLYAGTGAGLFVSLDRGGTWTSLRGKLPNVPVTDLVVHPRDNDLVVATAGRGIWILDDVTPLQELSDQVISRGAHLFPVRGGTQWTLKDSVGGLEDDVFTGRNPEPGTTLTYWLGEVAAGGVRLLVKDARGVQVREIDGSAAAGLQRISWDLRAQAAQAAAPLTDMGASLGAFVRPGDYEVTLVVDRKGCGTQRVRIEADPLIEIPDTERDLHQRAIGDLTEMQNTVGSAAAALDAIWSQLHAAHDRLQRSTIVPGPVCSAGTVLVRKVVALRRLVVSHTPRLTRKVAPQVHAMVGTQATLSTRVHALKADIAGSTSAPTPVQSQALQRLRREMSEMIEQLNAILTEELPLLNRMIERNGISPARVSTRPLPALPATNGRRAS